MSDAFPLHLSITRNKKQTLIHENLRVDGSIIEVVVRDEEGTHYNFFTIGQLTRLLRQYCVPVLTLEQKRVVKEIEVSAG